MKKYAYVQINGGLGKNIAFTQLGKEIKEKYDFLAVTSPYTDVFESCAYVDYVYKPNEIKDFISDAKHNNAEIFIDRIYDTSDFIYKRMTFTGGLLDRNVVLSDKDLRILKKLITEEQQARKNRKK